MLGIAPEAVGQSPNIYVSCWVESHPHPITHQPTQITKCRLAGGEIVEYRRDSEVPVVLNPNLGTDLNGPCWFLTSMSTPYVIVDQAANGEAAIAIDPPTGGNTSLIPLGYFPRCTSEPRTDVWREGRIWEYLASYLHPPPTPAMSPDVGLGVTGMPSYAAVGVPDPHYALIGDVVGQLELEVLVIAVVIDWGDGTVVTFPPDRTVLSGYPGGGAWHIYQAKGNSTSVTVSYLWDVRWREPGNPWETLPVPPTTTALDYPISEIVSVLQP